MILSFFFCLKYSLYRPFVSRNILFIRVLYEESMLLTNYFWTVIEISSRKLLPKDPHIIIVNNMTKDVMFLAPVFKKSVIYCRRQAVKLYLCNMPRNVMLSFEIRNKLEGFHF